MSLASKLKTARESAGLSQGELANAVGASQSYLSQLETGRRKSLPPQLASALAARLNVPLAHFGKHVSRQGKSAVSVAATYPELGIVEAGGGLHEPAEPGSRVSLPDECHGADGVYRVQGTSMIGAGILNGDLLVVQRTDTPENDDLVVAHLEDRGCVVKRAEVNESPGEGRQVVLHCEGEDPAGRYPHLMTASDQVFGVVIAVFRSYRNRLKQPARVAGAGKKAGRKGSRS